MSDRARNWGVEGSELTAEYPCERYLPEPRHRLLRGVTVEADNATVFRWVCQLKEAPYSYDLLDNLGRRSPRELTPGVEQLAIGQLMMVVRIVEYDDGRHITGVSTPSARRLFGRLALTYQVTPLSERRSRLVACLAVARGGRLSSLRAEVLAYGDLVMMRKQLLTLKECAERTAAQARTRARVSCARPKRRSAGRSVPSP